MSSDVKQVVNSVSHRPEDNSVTITVTHGDDKYRVVGEKHKSITVRPAVEVPDCPGSRYPWPVGIPWAHTAASYVVCLYRRERGLAI